MLKLKKSQNISIATADLKEALDFYTGVLGFKLIALHREGEEGVRAVMRVGPAEQETLFTLFYHPKIEKFPPMEGVSEAGDPVGTVAPGSLQHLAFTLDSYEDLCALNDRLRAAGIWTLGPIDHGFCHSSYCKGPEGINFEFASDYDTAVEPNDWIDPATAEKYRISPTELNAFSAGRLTRQ